MPKDLDWSRSIFLAHSSADKPLVRALCNKLKDHGLEPWLDEDILQPGDEWDTEIRSAIRRSRFFLACLSRDGVGKAGYLQRELRLALSALEEKPPGTTFLIPGLLEDVDLPDITVGTVSLRSYQYVRLYEQPALTRLIDTLKQAVALTTQKAGPPSHFVDSVDVIPLLMAKLDQFAREKAALKTLSEHAHAREDFAAELRYLEIARGIDSNDPDLLFSMAQLYGTGKGVEKDISRAIELLETAAQAGHVEAKTQLAINFYHGFGVPRDVAKAIPLLRVAADAGAPEAMTLLGLAYLSGEGVESDPPRAVALLEKAAHLGDMPAQSALSEVYRHGGIGVTRSPKEAVRWAIAAARQGEAGAIEYLTRYAKHIASRFDKE